MPQKPRVVLDKTVQNRSNKHIKARENAVPVYESQEFVPPITLTEKELEIWKWLVGIFRETVNCKVSDADVHLMELYCRAKVATDEADAELKKDPRAFTIVALGVDKDGKPKTTAKPNPNLKKRADNAALCIKLFAELGLSPLARARAGLKSANAKTELDIFKELMERTDD